jgi:signal transduction histidine kinase
MTSAPVPSDEDAALSAIAHGLRDPLQGVIGYVELMELGRYGGVAEDLRGPLARVSAHARTLAGRLEVAMGLMSLAFGEALGKARETTSPLGPAGQAIRRASEDAADPAVRIESRVNADLPPVPGSADQLVTLFLAMLRIALAAPGSRHLRLHGEAEGSGEARFHVEAVPAKGGETASGRLPGEAAEEVALEVTVLNLLALSLGGRVEWPDGTAAGSTPVLALPFAGEGP